MPITFCGLTAGVGLSCEKIGNAVGGANQRFWIGSYNAVESFTIDATTKDIEAIVWVTGTTGLYEFAAARNSLAGTGNTQLTDGGIPYFTHGLNATLYAQTSAEREALESLAKSTVFCIVQRNTNQFEVFGWAGGMTIESMESSTGLTAQDNTGYQLVLTGDNARLPKIFFDTSFSTTLSTIEGYVVP